jgi:hypothetical protein
MTVAFFIHVVNSLLRNPNIDQLVDTIRNDFAAQLAAKEEELDAQIAEGRKPAINQVVDRAKIIDLRDWIKRTFSHHSAQRVFEFWFGQQGRQQIRAHDDGTL